MENKIDNRRIRFLLKNIDKGFMVETYLDTISINEVVVSKYNESKQMIDLECIRNVKNEEVNVFINDKFDRMEIVQEVAVHPATGCLSIVFKSKPVKYIVVMEVDERTLIRFTGDNEKSIEELIKAEIKSLIDNDNGINCSSIHKDRRLNSLLRN